MRGVLNQLLQAHGYKYKSVIGEGGFAICMRVLSLRYNQEFVAKAIHLKQRNGGSLGIKKLRKSYESEVTALCNIFHPNVLCIYDHFEEGNYLFLILEFCDGGSIDSLLKKSVTVNPLDLIKYLKQIVEALAYCHSQQIAHRDIKPANILLHKGVIKLADFGIASIGKDHLAYGSGSFPFLAPEVFTSKEYDPYKADVWALGVTVYIIAVGTYPFPLTDKERYKRAIQIGSYELPNSLHPAVTRFIKQCLVVDPNQRWSSMNLRDYINQIPIRRVEEIPRRVTNYYKSRSHTKIGLPGLRPSIMKL